MHPFTTPLITDQMSRDHRARLRSKASIWRQTSRSSRTTFADRSDHRAVA